MTRSFKISWAPGSSAVFDMSIPSKRAELTFIPPFRGTLRLPVQGDFTLLDLASAANKMGSIFPVSSTIARNGNVVSNNPQAGGGARPQTFTIKDLGLELCQVALPQQVEVELGCSGLFLEIGTDEKLQEYPWELMHDGSEFYCLKHFIGRFVNASERLNPPGQILTDEASVFGPFKPLKVLVICVDNSTLLQDLGLSRLPNAYLEMQSVTTTLGLIDGVQVEPLGELAGTYDNVREKLSSGEFQIVHFIGHTHVDPKEPRESGLILQDRLMTANNVFKFLTKKARPVLCFINGCESSRSVDVEEVSSGAFGLARAILESGSYLVGTRWKVADAPASKFAPAFYKSLLTEEKPIGQAVTEARLECRRNAPADPAWASYAYYGDPRVCFQGQ